MAKRKDPPTPHKTPVVPAPGTTQTKFQKTVLWATEFVKMEVGDKKQTTKLEIASINGKPSKLFIRTWEKNGRTGYDGPTKEGMTIEYDQLELLIENLEAALEAFGDIR